MYLHMLLYHIVDLDVLTSTHSCATSKHDPKIVKVLHSCTCSQGTRKCLKGSSTSIWLSAIVHSGSC